MDTDATFLATLRKLFPRVTLKPPKGEGEPQALGAVVGADPRAGELVIRLELGGEIHFHADVGAWRVIVEHMKTGEVKFEDPAFGLRQLAEVLGTLRDHLDA